MAERKESGNQNIGFKATQLFKDQNLGMGGYGAVCKAKCDDLLCAAKILHPTLFDPTAHQQIARRREHRLPIKRFEQECEFMSAIRHPNIVQYLCTYRDPDTGLPVLLMELMDDSLTHFLESSTQPIPYHIQVNICHDITLALSFLHSNNIIHRDLSGNNVLLIGNIRAKVTDFGMARLDDINPQATRHSFTMCPGTDVYMPPEAFRAQSEYSEKVDCFSFGVIIVQILCRQFPKPGDRLKVVHTNDPQFRGGIIEVRVSEVERRHNHISQIDNDQPLMLIANDCLKDDDTERPSAQQLLERVAVLKQSPEYIESARPVQEILNEKESQIQEAQGQIRTLNSDVETKEQALRVRKRDIETKKVTIATLEEEKTELQQHMESQREQHDMAIMQKNQTIERVRTEKKEAIETIEAEKQNLQTKLENEQQIHIEDIAERDQMIADKEVQIADKEKLNHELQGVIRANEECYHSKLILQQERHVQEIVEQAETIAARENEIQKLHENMKKESEQLLQENQKYRQENLKFQQENQKCQQESERVQQEIKERFQQELQEKKEEIEVLQEAARAENVKFQQEIERKRKEIQVLRETIRNDNVKFQQEILRCQQRHYEVVKEKNEAMISTLSKESKQPLLRACSCDELWELFKPYCNKWYQLGIKFGLERRDLRSLIPYGYGIPTDPQKCLELMLKMRFDKCEVTWLDVVMVLYRQLAKPHSCEDDTDVPDYKIQKREIHAALQQRLKDGDTWLLVDVKWMKQWKKYVGYDQWQQNYVGLEAAHPGPVCNAALLRDRSIAVRYHLMEEQDYFLLPETAWNKLTSWYGLLEQSTVIARKVAVHGEHQKVEVYLLKFKLTIHPNIINFKLHSFSRVDTVENLETALKQEFEVEEDAECRVWHRSMTHTYELLSNPSQTLQDAGLYDGQIIVLEKRNKDGSWPRQT